MSPTARDVGQHSHIRTTSHKEKVIVARTCDWTCHDLQCKAAGNGPGTTSYRSVKKHNLGHIVNCYNGCCSPYVWKLIQAAGLHSLGCASTVCLAHQSQPKHQSTHGMFVILFFDDHDHRQCSHHKCAPAAARRFLLFFSLCCP